MRIEPVVVEHHPIAKSFWVVLAALIIWWYLNRHNTTYQNCYVQPGIFSWPNVCI